MKFSCSTKEILQAINLVSRAISSQQTLPILGNILFQAEGKRCSFSATNLEFSIITHIDAEVENEGSLTVPAKAIQNFTQYVPDDRVLFESSEGAQLKCLSERARTIIAGEAASEYPAISPIQRESFLHVQGESLLSAIQYVTFASAKTTTRPVLAGVFLRVQKGELIFAATDSYRLSEYKIPAVEVQGEVHCIIPTRVLSELSAILTTSRRGQEGQGKDPEHPPLSPIIITLSSQQVEVSVERTKVLSRLIDGSFPDYEQILPTSSRTVVVLPLAEFLSDVRRMHYFAKESNNNLTFTISQKEVLLQTQQTQIGRDESKISAGLQGEKNKIALSSAYLLDFLSHVSGEEVQMELIDRTHPAVLRIPNMPSYLHLIMPLRMSEDD